MALRLFYCSEIWHNLFRLHNDLTQQQNARANDLTDHTHHPHNRMYLRKIPAACAKLLPDIRHCVNPDNINSLICQEQDLVHHLIKNARIAIVQIPLVRIE